MNREIEKSLPGFEKIQRYWDSGKSVFIAKIQPGEYYVTRSNEAITTVLGSCVSACIRDKDLGIGGMNHFMLPLLNSAAQSPTVINESACYGNFAMELLINQIIKAGGRRRALEVKLFGGGKVVKSLSNTETIGEKNVKFILNYIYDENLSLLSKDLGGSVSRSIIFYPKTGKVLMKHLADSNKDEIIKEEKIYQEQINQIKPAADFELF